MRWTIWSAICDRSSCLRSTRPSRARASRVTTSCSMVSRATGARCTRCSASAAMHVGSSSSCATRSRAASRELGEGLMMRTNRVAAHPVFEGRVLRSVLPQKHRALASTAQRRSRRLRASNAPCSSSRRRVPAARCCSRRWRRAIPSARSAARRMAPSKALSLRCVPARPESIPIGSSASTRRRK